jgi:hypothetical protein
MSSASGVSRAATSWLKAWWRRSAFSGRVYLNFDKDWRKDFTVLIERKDGEAFKAVGIDPKALAGKRLRVRGWIEWRNRPMIHVTHVEQIELLPDGGGSPRQAPEAPGAGIAL